MAGARRYTEGRRFAVIGSLGLPELILIFVVALLLFGPRRMPDIGRSIGRALGEFRRASNDFKRTIENEVAADEIRTVEKDLREVANHSRQVLASGPADDQTVAAEQEGK